MLYFWGLLCNVKAEQMQAEDLLSRALKLLQGATRVSGFSQTDLDDAIGRRRGYLSHVFQRRVDLKLGDLLRALDALEIDPRDFFDAVAAGAIEEQPSLDELLRLAASQRQRVFRPRQDDADPDLMAKVQQAVRQVLAESKAD